MGLTCAQNVATSQFPMPVAKAAPLLRTWYGRTSLMYVQDTGPKEKEKRIVTQKRNATPAMLRPSLLPSSFWLFMTPSQTSAIAIAMVPKIRGFLRPTRSTMKKIKTKSVDCSC